MQLNVFGSIRHTLQPSQLLHELEERSAKGLCVGIDPAGYKVSDLRSKVADVARTVKVFDGKFLSTGDPQIHGLFADAQPTHSILRLQDLRIPATRLKGPQKEDVLQTSLIQECLLQLQEPGLAATVTNTHDNGGDP